MWRVWMRASERRQVKERGSEGASLARGVQTHVRMCFDLQHQEHKRICCILQQELQEAHVRLEAHEAEQVNLNPQP